MNPDAVRIYQNLPYVFRCAAASLWGYCLRRRRYGPETEKLVREAEAREFWDAAEWDAWRRERLSRLLHDAATKVPYYRNYWRERASGHARPWEDLSKWPVLTKEEIRKNPKAFVAEDAWSKPLFMDATSGSTGTPLKIWSSRETLHDWYALFEARWRRWYGVRFADRWGILGGQLVVRKDALKPPYWVWNAAFNQLYLSSYHLSPQTIPDYLSAISSHRLLYLWGYTSALDTLASVMIEKKLKPPVLKVIISNAEPVYEYQRARIESAFQCPLRETYGMAEMVTAASECERGRLHLWPEAGIVEVLNEHEKKVQGQTGDIVSTGLINFQMPLIRYKTGDRGALGEGGCGCKRTLPLLRSVEGRQDDVLYTSDGRAVGRLDPVFKGDFAFREAQIVQESLHHIRILIVPDSAYSENMEKQMISGIRERLGEVSVTVEKVSGIPRTEQGKFRAVVNRVRRDNKDSEKPS